MGNWEISNFFLDNPFGPIHRSGGVSYGRCVAKTGKLTTASYSIASSLKSASEKEVHFLGAYRCGTTSHGEEKKRERRGDNLNLADRVSSSVGTSDVCACRQKDFACPEDISTPVYHGGRGRAWLLPGVT